MKLIPLGKVVIIRQARKDDVSKNGLYLPDMHDSLDTFTDDDWNMKKGEVTAIGGEVTKVKVGDKIVIKNNSLCPITNKKEAEVLGIVYENDILVIYED